MSGFALDGRDKVSPGGRMVRTIEETPMTRTTLLLAAAFCGFASIAAHAETKKFMQQDPTKFGVNLIVYALTR